MIRFVYYGLICVVLTGCFFSSNRVWSGLPMPQQTFAHVEPIRLNVARIEVTDVSNNPPLPQDFTVSPVDAAIQYFSKKMKASEHAGPQHGIVLVQIEEASVVKEHKDASGFFASKLGVGGLDAYHMRLRVSIEYRDQNNDLLHGKVINADRKFSISEHSSLAKREDAQLKSIEAVFDKIDDEVTRTLLEEMRLGAL